MPTSISSIISGNGSININGKTYRGNSVSIINGKVLIDGLPADPIAPSSSGKLEVHITGNVASLTTDCDVQVDGQVTGGIKAGNNVTCKNVNGHIDAGGSVSCEDVKGDVDAGGSVSCKNVTGDVDAGGSVVCGDVEGDVDAGGSIRRN